MKKMIKTMSILSFFVLTYPIYGSDDQPLLQDSLSKNYKSINNDTEEEVLFKYAYKVIEKSKIEKQKNKMKNYHVVDKTEQFSVPFTQVKNLENDLKSILLNNNDQKIKKVSEYLLGNTVVSKSKFPFCKFLCRYLHLDCWVEIYTKSPGVYKKFYNCIQNQNYGALSSFITPQNLDQKAKQEVKLMSYYLWKSNFVESN